MQAHCGCHRKSWIAAEVADSHLIGHLLFPVFVRIRRKPLTNLWKYKQ